MLYVILLDEFDDEDLLFEFWVLVDLCYVFVVWKGGYFLMFDFVLVFVCCDLIEVVIVVIDCFVEEDEEVVLIVEEMGMFGVYVVVGVYGEVELIDGY